MRLTIPSGMKTSGIVGIILIVLGVIALAYQGFSFRTHERERLVELGPLKVDATVSRERHIPLPPIVGIVALGAGIYLLVMAQRGKG
jgi:hypothetical protein